MTDSDFLQALERKENNFLLGEIKTGISFYMEELGVLILRYQEGLSKDNGDALLDRIKNYSFELASKIKDYGEFIRETPNL